VISWFFENDGGRTVELQDQEARMFIFSRPFAAVAAGLGTALLVVAGDALCQRALTPAPGPSGSAMHHVVHTPVTCNRDEPCGIVRAGS
jgi:hypothetical protein